MNAFEKIKERLEEETYDMEICEEQFDANSPYFIDVPYKMVKLEDALSIVSEVEAEFENEVCEWKNEKGMFIQNPHTGRKFSNEPSMKNIYCNTCGKKIKVVDDTESEYINKSTEHINKSSDCSTNWILCSERLPEVHKKVFISYRGRNGIERNMGYISIYDRKWHFYQGKLVTGEVIAWIPMLLPEPYNPEKGV